MQNGSYPPETPGILTPAPKKNHTALKLFLIFCLCAGCLIVGCFIGGAYLAARLDVPKETQPERNDAGTCDPASETGAPSETTSAPDTAEASVPVFREETVLPQTERVMPVPSLTEIYQNNVNSVVGILSEKTKTNIFGQKSTSASTGTGFLIRDDGYILTNYHVIENGSSCTVSLYSGETFKARVVGADSENDIAVLKIESDTPLTPVTLGDSDQLMVGEDLAIIGNPLGELTYTMTKGIVSALDRSINSDGTPVRMFQIDAAVNAGNSGGPAFDACGHVVGIVTAKVSSSSVEGLGFAIPINDAVKIASDLIRFGYVTGRPDLGWEVEDAYELYSLYAYYYGRYSSRLSGMLTSGIYVKTVLEGRAAAKAGLKAGDYVTGINDQTIGDIDAYTGLFRTLSPGDVLSLTVIRSGETLTLSMTVEEAVPDDIRQSKGETFGV